jgi:hypothetical protein
MVTKVPIANLVELTLYSFAENKDVSSFILGSSAAAAAPTVPRQARPDSFKKDLFLWSTSVWFLFFIVLLL